MLNHVTVNVTASLGVVVCEIPAVSFLVVSLGFVVASCLLLGFSCCCGFRGLGVGFENHRHEACGGCWMKSKFHHLFAVLLVWWAMR